MNEVSKECMLNAAIAAGIMSKAAELSDLSVELSKTGDEENSMYFMDLAVELSNISMDYLNKSASEITE